MSDTKAFEVLKTEEVKLTAELGKDLPRLNYNPKVLASSDVINDEPNNQSIISKSGRYVYSLLPEFNPSYFADLSPSHVARNLLTQGERHLIEIASLTDASASPNAPELTEDQLTHLAWTGLWCASLWYQLPEELPFRLEQLLEVVGLLKDTQHCLSKDFFLLIMQSCMSYGTPEMVVKVYKAIQDLGIGTNGRICAIYFKAILNMKKEKNVKEHTASIKEMLAADSKSKKFHERKGLWRLDVESHRYREKTSAFKPRTFCTGSELFVLGDKAYILADQIACPSCSLEERYDDAIRRVNKEGAMVCRRCRKDFLPHVSYQIGTQYVHTGGKAKTCVKAETMLVTPKQLKEFVEALTLRATNRVKIDVASMRAHYPKIILNSIWLFKRKKLPYDLFLPYKKDIYYEQVVQSVPSIVVSDIEDWEEEDKNELKMQQQYEEKIKKKIAHKDTATQTDDKH